MLEYSSSSRFAICGQIDIREFFFHILFLRCREAGAEPKDRWLLWSYRFLFCSVLVSLLSKSSNRGQFSQVFQFRGRRSGRLIETSCTLLAGKLTFQVQ